MKNLGKRYACTWARGNKKKWRMANGLYHASILGNNLPQLRYMGRIVDRDACIGARYVELIVTARFVLFLIVR
jgi:hypothetical protein